MVALQQRMPGERPSAAAFAEEVRSTAGICRQPASLPCRSFCTAFVEDPNEPAGAARSLTARPASKVRVHARAARWGALLGTLERMRVAGVAPGAGVYRALDRARRRGAGAGAEPRSGAGTGPGPRADGGESAAAWRAAEGELARLRERLAGLRKKSAGLQHCVGRPGLEGKRLVAAVEVEEAAVACAAAEASRGAAEVARPQLDSGGGAGGGKAYEAAMRCLFEHEPPALGSGPPGAVTHPQRPSQSTDFVWRFFMGTQGA